ncbi:MAG: hypothetical protein AAF399_22715 [Bacteroidota bacterium]
MSLVHRSDQLSVQAHFAAWELFVGTRPGIRRWEQGEVLLEQYWDIWARKDAAFPWRFQLMWLNTKGEEWLFKRNEAIRGPLAELYHRSSEGIPYLRPEIQLLYKLTSSSLRPKDQLDVEIVWPKLSSDAQGWLRQQLQQHDLNQLSLLQSLIQAL